MRGAEYVNVFQPVNKGTLSSYEADNAVLENLGFEEGELEMFFDMAEGSIGNQELIDRYIEIAQSEPYNQNWQTVDDAIHAEYSLNTLKPNGHPYTKHDIANHVLNSFYEGGRRRSRKNSRKNYRKNSRRSRKNYRRSRRSLRRSRK
jgi:hypothetical protein